MDKFEQAIKLGDFETFNNLIEDVPEGALKRKELNKILLSLVHSIKYSSKIGEINDCVSNILSAGAMIDAIDNDTGRTVLMIACEKGYIEIVDSLLKADAMVNSRDNKSKNALFYAIMAKGENTDIVQLLLSKEAELNYKSLDGLTALNLAT